MLFSHINWDGEGGLHYFTKDIQKSVLGCQNPAQILAELKYLHRLSEF